MATTASRMQAIREKVEAAERLSFDDGLALEESNDLFALGAMANRMRERTNGNFGYYNVNTHINPTNVCVYKCDFCAFRADLDDPRGYVMDHDQIVERAGAAHARGATELHIVGGLHHKLPFDYYVDVVRWIHDAYPAIHIKAYTGVEIEFFAQIARLSIEQVLRRLVDAGLGSLPGGGAEIFHPEVRDEICAAKASTETWLEVHRTAHRLGLHSNATMLYGHIEKARHRIDHLVRLRTLQDETGGFQTFIPLAFHPDNSRMDAIPKPSGVMDLKTMAISRLMLENFPHIKAYWVMLGIKTAQVALAFGADDLDGTVVHEKIYHEAGAETPQEVTVAEIRRLITEAGRIPVERDTLYHRVERDGTQWASREPITVAALAGARWSKFALPLFADLAEDPAHVGLGRQDAGVRTRLTPRAWHGSRKGAHSMRDHNKVFCRLVAETFDCPGPVFEFGSYQVEGQVDYADLRTLFAGKDYVGCDMRPGPGVDRVEDVSAIGMPDASAGTVLCIETFEHVFEVRRAFDEVFRILKPGGLFVITSPLNFRIHGYPDDYWRMTPNCLRRMLEPYAARLTGYQGYHKFPHSVMGLGVKAPAPADVARKADLLVGEYRGWLQQAEATLPLKEKVRRGFGQLYRSRGERYQSSAYYRADFTLDVSAPVPLAQAG